MGSREPQPPAHLSPLPLPEAGSIPGVPQLQPPQAARDAGGKGLLSVAPWSAVSPFPIHTGDQNELYLLPARPGAKRSRSFK